MVITKISSTYKNPDEQNALVNEAHQKAVRTFIMGLRSQMIRNILYSHKPNNLTEAFSTAQMVFYDTQYLQLDQNRDQQRNQARQQNVQMKGQQQRPPWPQERFNINMNVNEQQQQQVFQPKYKPEPMNVDPSNHFKFNANLQPSNAQMNGPQKRDYNSSRQQFQQPNKVQRINQLRDDEPDSNEGYGMMKVMTFQTI